MERCQQLTQELGLSWQVCFLGQQSHEQVQNLMRESDVFVQHSVTSGDGNTEGLPVAILEAMASGLPVVSTRHSGIPEAVDDGVTGILVSEGDWAAMGRGMLALVDGPVLASRMGHAGRDKVVRCFGRDQAISRLRSLLERNDI